MKKEAQLIEEMFQKGILLNKEMLKAELDTSFIEKIETEADLLVLNDDYAQVLSKQSSLVDWYEIDQLRVEAEKYRNDDLYQDQLQHLKQSTLIVKAPSFSQKQEVSSLEIDLGKAEEGKIPATSPVPSSLSSSLSSDSSAELASNLKECKLESSNKIEIIVSYENKPHKYEVKDFTQIFLSRFRFLEGILRNRHELQSVMSISRLLSKKEKEKVALIGLVSEISETKKNNLILSLEDTSGKINVLFSIGNKELLQQAKDIVLDEVVGITGVLGDKIIFAESIVFPDLPLASELKKGEQEDYVLFLSDIHVGSKLFMREEFGKFLRWINGEAGNESQREIAQKVKYIIIAGDLVDGIGIYPTQADELEIKDVILQYEDFCNMIKKIPPDKQIIICPGNHDAVHLAEPQSSFDKNFAPSLFNLPNVLLVTNPATINIGRTKTFSGFDILMYHGFSFDHYVASVESIRNNGGYNRADLIMKFLLKKRHLAPTFKSTPYFPGHNEDPLLIKKVPDFFVSGHIHYSNVANYRGVTTICGGCWQEKTSFQEKMGHEPEPARIPVVNLKTREVKILKFI